MIKNTIKILIPCLIIFFTGCFHSTQIFVKNNKDSNLNLNQDAVPVTIFLFQLRDIAKFKDTPLDDLIQRTDAVLGRDKIDTTKMQITPNSEKFIATINKKEVPYIGLLAVYNRIDTKKKVKSLIQSSKISKDLLIEVKSKGIFIMGKNRNKELIK